MKRFSALFLSAVLAGICISLGTLIYLRVKDLFPGANIVGAFFFSIGLLCICTRGYALFTGKACYLCDNPLPSYLWELLVIWVGNFVGCILTTAALSLTSLFGPTGVNAIALRLVEQKSQTSYLSLFILGLFCCFFIFLAVNGFANNPHEIGKYVILIFGVVGFIVTGTEHSIADMFYWSVSGKLYTDPSHSLLCLLAISLGNLAGGLLFRLADKAKLRLER